MLKDLNLIIQGSNKGIIWRLINRLYLGKLLFYLHKLNHQHRIKVYCLNRIHLCKVKVSQLIVHQVQGEVLHIFMPIINKTLHNSKIDPVLELPKYLNKVWELQLYLDLHVKMVIKWILNYHNLKSILKYKMIYFNLVIDQELINNSNYFHNHRVNHLKDEEINNNFRFHLYHHLLHDELIL